jgi:DNA-binding transcriptional LysR family regulator
MVLLVNNANPLSRYREVDLRTCENENFLNLDRDTNLQQFISTIYHAAGFTPHVIMEVDYTLRDEMVAQNYGVSITTETSARKSPAKGVTYLHITYPPFRRKLGLVWSTSALFSPPMEKFRQFALDYYRS